MVAVPRRVAVRFLHDLAVVRARHLDPPAAIRACSSRCIGYVVRRSCIGQSIYVGGAHGQRPPAAAGHAPRPAGRGPRPRAWRSSAPPRRHPGQPAEPRELPHGPPHRGRRSSSSRASRCCCIRDAGWRPSGARGSTGFVRALRRRRAPLGADPNYRVFLFFHLLNAMAARSAPFIVPFAKERLARGRRPRGTADPRVPRRERGPRLRRSAGSPTGSATGWWEPSSRCCCSPRS